MSKKDQQTPVEDLKKLFEETYGKKPEAFSALPISGSDRRYYRLSAGNDTAIGTFNSNVAENNSYFYFTKLFRKHNVNVPEVYQVSKDHKTYLQQDLGDTTLFDELMEKGYTDKVKEHYRQSIEQLAVMQWVAGQQADFKQCHAISKFDEKAIMADLMYFKYYFADLQKINYDRSTLMDELRDLSKVLGRVQPQMLMYRDFQSRNILMKKGKPFFIDFQGAMQGPPQYDIASLLWQAKAQLPAQWREDLLTSYITAMHDLPVPRIEEIHFRKGYSQFVLLRLLQVLGAYGFRGLLERKPHFISSIYPALANLEIFLNDFPHQPPYPELRKLMEALASPALREQYKAFVKPDTSKLEVTVCSFSYKNGIPKDKTSHGGGYVFDCRGLLNPGRYASYKHLSGKDSTVVEFLETQTKMPQFMEQVRQLVSLNVEDYLSRGFEHLSISFGCTGGQHRSVYAAESLAKFLKSQYGVPVTLKHLNEEKWVTTEELP